MFFRIMDDGFGGFIAYETTPGMESFYDVASGPILAICFVIGPIMTLLLFGEYLALPLILILFGFLLLYTPESKEIQQNALLTFTKIAISVPLFAYGVTCFPYIMGKAAEGTTGLWVLLTVIVGAIPILLTTVSTHGLSIPLIFLWFGSFFSTTGDGFPTITNFLLQLTYLEGVGIFIYGLIKTIKEKDKHGIFILPKIIAFGLGCIPLGILICVSGFSDWVIAITIIVAYCIVFWAYHFLFNQPKIFTDWLIYPLLLVLGCYFVIILSTENI